jgi:hypothetical protein
LSQLYSLRTRSVLLRALDFTARVRAGHLCDGSTRLALAPPPSSCCRLYGESLCDSVASRLRPVTLARYIGVRFVEPVSGTISILISAWLRRGNHRSHIGPVHIPEAPFGLALRCEAVSNVPQMAFNDDDVWHDLAPDRAAVKAGPWFQSLFLLCCAYYAVAGQCRCPPERPQRAPSQSRAESDGMVNKAPAAASADGAGAAAGEDDEYK